MDDVLDSEKTATDKSELAEILERLNSIARFFAFIPFMAALGLGYEVFQQQKYSSIGIILVLATCFVFSLLSYVLVALQPESKDNLWAVRIYKLQFSAVAWVLFWLVLRL